MWLRGGGGFQLKAFSLTQDEVGRKCTQTGSLQGGHACARCSPHGALAGWVAVTVVTSAFCSRHFFLLFSITLCLHVDRQTGQIWWDPLLLLNQQRSCQICQSAVAPFQLCLPSFYLIVMRRCAESSSIIKQRWSTELHAVPAHHRNLSEFNT